MISLYNNKINKNNLKNNLLSTNYYLNDVEDIFLK